jgi:hypothetical protein
MAILTILTIHFFLSFSLFQGISYFLVVENMLLHIGGVKANLVGLLITIAISLLVCLTSLYGPLATMGAWIFMILLPFDPSHAGINGMLSKLYDANRHGVLGVGREGGRDRKRDIDCGLLVGYWLVIGWFLIIL